MVKFFNTGGMYLGLFVCMLFLLAWSAGCSELSDTGTMTPTSTIPPFQAKFGIGDIISKTVSSPDPCWLILKYDPLTEKYERAYVQKKSDGHWYRYNEKSEFVDRVLTEKIYTVTAGHVSSLSLVPVEACESVSPDNQVKNIPSTPGTQSAQSLRTIGTDAQFTASPLQGQAPLMVQFTALCGSAGEYSYAWDINNDGITEYTSRNPQHTFLVPGNYTVRQIVTNTSGSFSEIKTNYIHVTSAVLLPLPVAQFTASTTFGKPPLTVRFTDKSLSTGTTTYAWDINNDGIVDYTIKNPLHTYPAAGSYTVKLTVTNISGSNSVTKSDYITISSSQSGDCYGAEACNPTGNPIGGGAGYNRILSEKDPDVTYSVSTRDQLLSALKRAQPGEVVFVKGSAVIDMTGTPDTVIPDGVTLASDRGIDGSPGALILYTFNNNGRYGTSLFKVAGNNVRVTGLRLEGEMLPRDGTGNGEASYLVAITVRNKAGLEVDNCEIRGWAWSCVTTMDSTGTYIHHNYMHHNQARGEGYGADIYGGDMLVEANIFNYNRHDIAAGGYPGEMYEARYNLVRGDGHPIGSHHFDVHACNPYDYSDDSETSSLFIAGDLYKIHHNTFEPGPQAPIGIRSRPVTGAHIYNNIFMGDSTDTQNGVPVWQRAVTFGNMFVTDNYWEGTLYGGDEIVWYLHP